MKNLVIFKTIIFILGTVVGCSVYTVPGISRSFTQESYLGVNIGDSPKDALSKLNEYVSHADEDEMDSCYYLTPKGGKAGALFMVESGGIVRIDVYDETLGISTKLGYGIGTPKIDIIEGYGKVKVEPHPYNYGESEYLIVNLENGYGIIFETSLDVVTSFRLGSFPAVGYIEGCL